MKIAFVWYFGKASQILDNWRDGLRAAIEIIEKDHKVEWFLDEKVPDPNEKWDAVLFWSDSTCPFFSQIDNYNAKKGIFLTTDPMNIYNLKKLDAVFCESTPVFDDAKKYGLTNAIKAFGTDTEFYKPDLNIKKDIMFFYPATFSPWKRQDVIASLGGRLLCVGTVQPDGMNEYGLCKKMGVRIEEG